MREGTRSFFGNSGTKTDVIFGAIDKMAYGGNGSLE